MDQQVPAQLLTTNPSSAKPGNWTKWIIVFLLMSVFIGTGITYLIWTYPEIKQTLYTVPSTSYSGNIVPKNTKTIQVLQVWQKYSNSNHNYSFVYTGSWSLKQKSNNGDFILRHVSQADPGVIEGSFFPPNRGTKNYCEENREDTDQCLIRPMTANRELIMDMTSYLETGKIIAFIVHPTQGTIVLDITDVNFESTSTLQFMISTMQFTDENRITKLLFCPDKWSEDRKIGFFQGVGFDAKDIGEQCI